MSDENELPEWIAPGKKVYEATAHRWSNVNYQLKIATVTKLTATQIVLDSGERYRRRNLERIESREMRNAGFYRPTTRLMDPTSDEVKKEIELHRVERIASTASIALGDAQKNIRDLDAITKAIEALVILRKELP